MSLVRPLLFDHLSPSTKPLTVEVWRGNIAESHESLQGTDVVIGIEIIEHLHQPVLDKVPGNVFGFIKPKVALFSTPNSEYNVLFDGLLENGFRHPDHKFEWTRAQFEAWADAICQRFPEYCVKFIGIGPAPAGSEALGCVSQLAVFVRKDFLATLNPEARQEQPVPPAEQASQKTDPANVQLVYNEEIGEIVRVQPCGDRDQDAEVNEFEEPSFGISDDVLAEEAWQERDALNDDVCDDDREYDDDDEELDMVANVYIPEGDLRHARARNDSGNFEEEEPLAAADQEYWMVSREVYPVAAPDHRSREERILEAAEYQLRQFRISVDDFLAPEEDRYLVPLYAIRNCMGSEVASIDDLRAVLSEAHYQINDDVVTLLMEEDDSSEEDFIEEDDVEEHVNVVGNSLEDYFETWD